MLTKAYDAQCASVAVHCTHPPELKNRRFTLFALAFGTFCIGKSEFASMGIIQLFSDSFRVDIPTATNAITAYAFGVVVGAPLVTLVASRLNRRTLLFHLMALFVAAIFSPPYRRTSASSSSRGLLQECRKVRISAPARWWLRTLSARDMAVRPLRSSWWA